MTLSIKPFFDLLHLPTVTSCALLAVILLFSAFQHVTCLNYPYVVCNGAQIKNTDQEAAIREAVDQAGQAAALRDPLVTQEASHVMIRGSTAWALAACLPRLDQEACVECVREAVSDAWGRCGKPVGIRSDMPAGCKLRYETYHVNDMQLDF